MNNRSIRYCPFHFVPSSLCSKWQESFRRTLQSPEWPLDAKEKPHLVNYFSKPPCYHHPPALLSKVFVAFTAPSPSICWDLDTCWLITLSSKLFISCNAPVQVLPHTIFIFHTKVNRTANLSRLLQQVFFTERMFLSRVHFLDGWAARWFWQHYKKGLVCLISIPSWPEKMFASYI